MSDRPEKTPAGGRKKRSRRPERTRAKGPSESDRGLLYGRRPVQAYLDSLSDTDATRITNVESILLGESLPKKLREELLRKLPGVPFAERPRRLLDQEYPDLHHQGVVLRFRPGSGPENKARDLDWKNFVREPAGLLVLLDRIQDPQNLGSILRSAEALGARAVFLTGQGAPLSDTAHRVSSGASLRLPVFQQTNLHRLVEYLKSRRYWICAAADPAAATNKGHAGAVDDPKHDRGMDLPPADEIALIIGNEGEGVKPLVLNESDFILSIPLRGKTESLNAGVAAGILIDRLMNRQPR